MCTWSRRQWWCIYLLKPGSPCFSWSMSKLAPAKWDFPFEVKNSLRSPESSMVANGGQQSAVVVGHRFQPWSFLKALNLVVCHCLKTLGMKCGWEDDTGDDWIDASVGSVSFLNQDSVLRKYLMLTSLHFSSKWWEIHKISCFSQMLPSWPELNWQQLFSWDFSWS